MLYDFLIYLPAIVCLFWMIIFSMMIARTGTFVQLMWLAGLTALFLFSDACYAAPDTTSPMPLAGGVVGQITAPAVIPLAWIYLMHLRGQEHFKPIQMFWIIFPAILGSTALMLILIVGPEEIQQIQSRMYQAGPQKLGAIQNSLIQAYVFITVYAFRGVIVGEGLVYGLKMILLARKDDIRPRHLRKLRQGEQVRVLEIQFFNVLLLTLFLAPKAFLTHATLMAHPWISTLLAVFITAGLFLFCFTALFGSKQTISSREVKNGPHFNYDNARKDEIMEQMISDLMEDAEEDVLNRIQSRFGLALPDEDGEDAPIPGEQPGLMAGSIISAIANSRDDDSLLSRFEALMLHEQAFLEPGLTLNSVAERLHSNKTYISRLVNNSYNLAFPDFINTLRIDYAEQYIISHRGAKQLEIATACGFTSASSFNNIFKKITGMTPKIWLATFDRQNQSHTDSL